MSPTVLALLNWVICATIGIISICRLAHPMCANTPFKRIKYVLLCTGATASGFQPIWFGSTPTYGTIVFTACVAATLLVEYLQQKQEEANDIFAIY